MPVILIWRRSLRRSAKKYSENSIKLSRRPKNWNSLSLQKFSRFSTPCSQGNRSGMSQKYWELFIDSCLQTWVQVRSTELVKIHLIQAMHFDKVNCVPSDYSSQKRFLCVQWTSLVPVQHGGDASLLTKTTNAYTKDAPCSFFFLLICVLVIFILWVETHQDPHLLWISITVGIVLSEMLLLKGSKNSPWCT